MYTKFEESILTIFNIIRILLLPCAWLETLRLSMLNVNTATPFRMFPICDALPQYPASMANANALLMMVLIPWLVESEDTLKSPLPVGILLHPLTQLCSCRVAYLLMFSRVWLYLALFSWHVVQLYENRHQSVFILVKISSSIFIL